MSIENKVTKRIICIGNRYNRDDAVGPKVYDILMSKVLPHDVEVIDGGLSGLNLLRFIEGAELVVFVDRVFGFGRPNEILILKAKDAASRSEIRYDHSAGLPYLLRVLPEVCEGKVPNILLVAIEGNPEGWVIEKAAELALKLTSQGKISDSSF